MTDNSNQRRHGTQVALSLLLSRALPLLCDIIGSVALLGDYKLHGVEMPMRTEKASERRHKPRVASKWPVTLTLPDGEISGVAENISPIGAFISVKDSPQLKGSFRMIIKPPHRQTLSVTAEVVWTTIFTSDEEEPCFGVGVRFVQISQSDSQFLHELVVSFYIV